MPCPCENDTMIIVEELKEISYTERNTTFQGNLCDFSLYVNEKNVIRIEKLKDYEYLIVWCESIN